MTATEPGSLLRPAPPLPPEPPASDRPTLAGVAIAGATLLLMLAALAAKPQLLVGLVLVAFIFVPIERLFPLQPRRVLRQGWMDDVIHFFVNNLLLAIGVVAVVVVFGVVPRALVGSGTQSAVASQPTWLQFAEALALAELCAYWTHRASHRIPALWRFHKVHHSIEDMDWLAAVRLHPIDQVFARSCVVLPLFILGFSRATFGAYLVISSLHALLIHANVSWDFGPLQRIVTSPAGHHWHHSGDPAAQQQNFAAELPVLDALFGTLRLPQGEHPAKFGLPEATPRGYLAQLAWPFRPARARVAAPNVGRVGIEPTTEGL